MWLLLPIGQPDAGAADWCGPYGALLASAVSGQTSGPDSGVDQNKRPIGK